MPWSAGPALVAADFLGYRRGSWGSCAEGGSRADPVPNLQLRQPNGLRAAVARAQPLEVFETMQTVLIIIHLIIVLALIGAVLLQRSEGGGTGLRWRTGAGQRPMRSPCDGDFGRASFRDEHLRSPSRRPRPAPRSILDGTAPAVPVSRPRAPQGGNVLEQLQRPSEGDQPAPNRRRRPQRLSSRTAVFRPSLFVDDFRGGQVCDCESWCLIFLDKGR